MAVSIPIDEMSVEEKIEAIEALWQSLAREPSNVPSPSWHGDVLAARQESVRAGAAEFHEWETCKRALREILP